MSGGPPPNNPTEEQFIGWNSNAVTILVTIFPEGHSILSFGANLVGPHRKDVVILPFSHHKNAPSLSHSAVAHIHALSLKVVLADNRSLIVQECID